MKKKNASKLTAIKWIKPTGLLSVPLRKKHSHGTTTGSLQGLLQDTPLQEMRTHYAGDLVISSGSNSRHLKSKNKPQMKRTYGAKRNHPHANRKNFFFFFFFFSFTSCQTTFPINSLSSRLKVLQEYQNPLIEQSNTLI